MAEGVIDKAVIVNWALADLGLTPNFSIDNATGIGGFVDIFWPRCLARTFGLHDWTFCRRTLPLTPLSATPKNGWSYGFTLPGDRLGQPLKVTRDLKCEQPIRNFDIEGDALFSNEPTAYARCKMLLKPEAWPLPFTDAFAVALAAYLSVPILQDADGAAEREARAFGSPSQGGAGGMFGRLIAQDRAAAPLGSPLLANDPLTAGRFTGNWYGG